MNSPALSDDTQTYPDMRAEDAWRHRELLNEMIQIGAERLRLGLQIEQARVQAELARLAAEPGHVASSEAASRGDEDYERVFRAMRRAMLLVQRLGEPVAARDDARVAVRRRLIREVEDGINYSWRGEAAERLQRAFAERLDGPELEDEIGTRPAGEIILDIRRDLGLVGEPRAHVPWKRRSQEEVAALHARAAAVPGEAGDVVLPTPESAGVDRWADGPDPGQMLPDDPEEAVAFLLQGTGRLRG